MEKEAGGRKCDEWIFSASDGCYREYASTGRFPGMEKVLSNNRGLTNVGQPS